MERFDVLDAFFFTAAFFAGLAFADRFAFAGGAIFVTGGEDNVNSVGNGAHSNVLIFNGANGGDTLASITPVVINGSDAGSAGFIFDYPTGLAATTR